MIKIMTRGMLRTLIYNIVFHLDQGKKTYPKGSEAHLLGICWFVLEQTTFKWECQKYDVLEYEQLCVAYFIPI